MRSRFAAFAVGAGDYLVATLSSDHPDRALPASDLARELGRAKDKQRFLGLRILHASADGDEGEVLFFAKVFEKGADRSFAELSRFVREEGRWRYASGDLVERARLPEDLDALDREAFIALVQPPPKSR